MGSTPRNPRAGSEHLFPNAPARIERRRLLKLSAKCRSRFHQTLGRVRHGYLPDFRFAERPPEYARGDGGGAKTHARHLRGNGLLHRRHPRPQPHEVFAEILHRPREGVGENGRAHPRGERYGRPLPSLRRSRFDQGPPRGGFVAGAFPHPRHERCEFRLAPHGRRGRGGCGGRRDLLDVRLDLAAEPQQPRRRAPKHAARLGPRSRRARGIRCLLGAGAQFLRAVRYLAAHRQCGGLCARDAGWAVHKPQGTSLQHGPLAPLARDRALLRGGEPTLRRHRESHALQQGRRRHGALPFHARHQARRCAESRARHGFPGVGERHARGRTWRADGRLAEKARRSRARKIQARQGASAEGRSR